MTETACVPTLSIDEGNRICLVPALSTDPDVREKLVHVLQTLDTETLELYMRSDWQDVIYEIPLRIVQMWREKEDVLEKRNEVVQQDDTVMKSSASSSSCERTQS